jgi:hypothetical protein
MLNSRYFGVYLTLITVLFCMGMYLYFNKKIVKLNNMHRIEKEIQTDLKNKQEWIKPLFSEKPFEVIPVLRTIIHRVEESGFHVQTLQPLHIEMIAGSAILPVNFLVVGPLNQLFVMLTHLLCDERMIGINHFSLQIDEHNIASVEMNIFILNNNTLQEKWELSKKPDLLQTFPIKQFKVVGYFHDEQHFFGLLMLPNGQTKAVQKGTIFGAEKGRIVSITENDMIISVRQNNIHLSQIESPFVGISKG